MAEKTSSSFPFTDLSMDIGHFQLSWTYFELYLEVLAHRILGTKIRHTSILFASLNFQAKQQITIALLKEQDDNLSKKLVSLIRTIAQEASRNHLIHSQVHLGVFDHHFNFLKRDIDNGFRVKSKRFTNKTFHQHAEDVSQKIAEL